MISLVNFKTALMLNHADISTTRSQNMTAPQSEIIWTPIMLCKFILVAKDPKTGKSLPVARLSPTNQWEERLILMGEGL